MQVAVRRVVVTIDLHRPELGDAGRVGRHQDHRMLLVFRPAVIGRSHHGDVDRAARIARTRRPPFLAVEHIMVAVPLAAHGDVGGIRRCHVRLRHQIGGADLAFEQRSQPAVLVRLRAVALQHLHVAGVGRRAVEGLRPQMRLAHFLGEIGVFHRRQAIAAIGMGEPEIPQPALARLHLEPFKNLGLPRRVAPAIPVFADFRQELLIEWNDLFAHHLHDLFVDRLQPLGHAEVHLGILRHGADCSSLPPSPR